MTKLTRRTFIATTLAAGAMRTVPVAGKLAGPKTKRVLELVYDKSLGMMRAVERVVH